MTTERLSIAEILNKYGSCTVVERHDSDIDRVPVKAYDNYPVAKKHAEELTSSTGIKHQAILHMRFDEDFKETK